jgi:hypothetical protein
MKKMLWVGFCVSWLLPVCAQEVKPAAAQGTPAATNRALQAVALETKPAAVADVVKPQDKRNLTADAGGDLRIRQELIDNLPMINGRVMPNQSYLRIRPRVWGEVKNEHFKLYMRVTDEFREYFQRRDNKNYQTPDEVIVDNLYFDLYNLFDGKLDLRVGRQDFFGATGPSYGAGRVLCDGTPFDGSRTVFMDAIKATIKFDEKNTLDLLAIYNSPDTSLSWGHPYNSADQEYSERPLTSINPASSDLTEWGGGAYFKSKEFDHVPFELYYLYKRESKAHLSGSNNNLPGRIVNTFGTRVMPQLTETVSAEFEGAVQAGEKDGGASTSGYMGYAGLTYKPLVDSTAKPYFTGSCYYLSGDSDRGEGDNDTGWDPLWSRWPQFSELYVYNFIYGAGYWSNLIYPSVEAGVGFAPGHKVRMNVGPMYAAVEDDLGSGGGDMYGWFGMARYDFPLMKNIFGKRGELFGHLTAELLDPGDYYTSDTVAYFLRWEITARF